jgi:hypothetical protein
MTNFSILEKVDAILPYKIKTFLLAFFFFKIFSLDLYVFSFFL